jgi:methylthioribose-1-phosphate isomerase
VPDDQGPSPDRTREPLRTIGFTDDAGVEVLDQTRLPHEVVRVTWRTVDDAAHGIATMQVRGAPLIGLAGVHGLALAMAADPSDAHLATSAHRLVATRPTAVNLTWAVERAVGALLGLPPEKRASAARAVAGTMVAEDVATCRALAEAGLPLLAELAAHHDRPVQVLTHCNAGWLAAVAWGTALAPVYLAHEQGIPIHVWVSETRPRNQGASLTAWELGASGVPHTVVADNAAGHLLASGRVDCCSVGADRVAANGDVANKIGTLLKAYAAAAHGVPFYVVAPVSTLDPDTPDGAAIPIEERDATEVTTVRGVPLGGGDPLAVRVTPAGSPARNWGFDVTPAHHVTALVTDVGVVACTAAGVAEALQRSPDRGTGPSRVRA